MPQLMQQVAKLAAFHFLARLTLLHGATLTQHQTPALRGVDKDLVPVNQQVNSPQTCVALTNWGAFSTVDISVGTPEQVFSVVADTGSDNVIIPSCLCQEMHRCFAGDRCFQGTPNSSSFAIDDGAEGPPGAVIMFGSGPIQVIISTDIVRVGKVNSSMEDGVLLMVDQELDFGGSFEGILGLGLPVVESETETPVGFSAAETHVSNAKVWKREEQVGDHEEEVGLISIRYSPGSNSSKAAKKQNSVFMSDERGFLQRAGVSRFSMCFNDGNDGALRLNPPVAEHTLGNVGREHWAVDFRGVSVGSNTTRLGFCGAADMLEGQETPCGGIPDSGTTAIMAPQEHLDLLYESLCDDWDRCSQNHSAMVAAASAANEAAVEHYNIDPFGIEPARKADIFQFLLMDCGSWLESSDTGLDELPSIHFAIRGKDGSEQNLEMTAWSYVVESSLEAKSGPGTGESLQLICEPAFSAMDYVTQLNGPVWILGTPFFYLFDVGYDLKASPPGISFTSVDETPCGSCSEGRTASLVSGSTGSLGTSATRQRHRLPRRISGPRRGSSIDTSRPL